MARQFFPAVIEKAKSGFGVWFPDIPGCTSGGDTIEEAVANAAEALDLWFEDATAVPRASPFGKARAACGPRDVAVMVPGQVPSRTERVMLSMSDATLEIADRMAKARGTTRSGLFAELVREAASRGNKQRPRSSIKSRAS